MGWLKTGTCAEIFLPSSLELVSFCLLLSSLRSRITLSSLGPEISAFWRPFLWVQVPGSSEPAPHRPAGCSSHWISSFPSDPVVSLAPGPPGPVLSPQPGPWTSFLLLTLLQTPDHFSRVWGYPLNPRI